MSWWEDFFDDLDSLDIERASAWYGDNIELRAGNSPIFRGKQAAGAALTQACANLQGLKHDIDYAVVSGEEVFIGCHVTFNYKDGRTVKVPAATYLRRAQNAIQTLHVYQHIPEAG